MVGARLRRESFRRTTKGTMKNYPPRKNKGKKKIVVDVMKDGWRYYCSFDFYYNPAFIITEEELTQAALQRFPTLKNEYFTLAFLKS